MKRSKLLLPMFVVLMTTVFLSTSCTDNQRARSWGGNMTINLEQGQKLVNVTWKDEDMWILTRPMKPGETPETYRFVEESTWGIMEGSATIIESVGNTSEVSGGSGGLSWQVVNPKSIQ